MIASLREHYKNSMQDERGVFMHPRFVNVCTSPRPCFIISVQAPAEFVHRFEQLSKTEKKMFFDSPAGKRVLPVDSMILLLSGEGRVVAVGTVAMRDSKNMLRQVPRKHTQDAHKGTHAQKGGAKPSKEAASSSAHDYFLEVGVSFFEPSVSRKLAFGMQSSDRSARIAGVAMLMQTNISFFSYEPVLRNLRDMASIPLHEELVKSMAVPLTDVPHAGLTVRDLDNKTQAQIASDPSQVVFCVVCLSLSLTMCLCLSLSLSLSLSPIIKLLHTCTCVHHMIHTYPHAHAHAHNHTHTHTNTYIHTYIHKYTHIQIHI
jgi:hypothetical protein